MEKRINKQRLIDENYSTFELEFCLTKAVYCKTYKEDGSLWDKQHKEQITIFHELIKDNKWQEKIVKDLQAFFWTYFNNKEEFFNSFPHDELTEDEINFLKNEINHLISFER